MFIKWREENRPLTPEQEEKIAHLRPAWATGKRNPSSHRFYAYLAKSSRVEGKPRQQIITYLGSIPAGAMQGYTGDEWRSFWYKVVCSMCRAGVDHSTFFEVLRGLETKVQRPPDRELVDILREEHEYHPRWHKDYEAVAKDLGRVDYYMQWAQL